jgi:hypothetical protein
VGAQRGKAGQTQLSEDDEGWQGDSSRVTTGRLVFDSLVQSTSTPLALVFNIWSLNVRGSVTYSTQFTLLHSRGFQRVFT